MLYPPPLSTRQFLTPGSFAEQRVLLLADILRLIQQTHEKLTPRKIRQRQLDDAIAKLTSGSYVYEREAGTNGLANAPSTLCVEYDLSTQHGLTNAIAKLLQCDTRALNPFKSRIARSAKNVALAKTSAGMQTSYQSEGYFSKDNERERQKELDSPIEIRDSSAIDTNSMYSIENEEGERMRRTDTYGSGPEHVFGFSHQYRRYEFD